MERICQITFLLAGISINIFDVDFYYGDVNDKLNIKHQKSFRLFKFHFMALEVKSMRFYFCYENE